MMRIKTYTSQSVPEALKMIKEELGPGAVILKTNRTVKKRLWGLLPAMAYEITAAADPSTAMTGNLAERSERSAPGTSLLEKPSAVAVAELPAEAQAKEPLETYEVAQTPPQPQVPRLAPGSDDVRSTVTARPKARLDDRWLEQFSRLGDDIQSLIRLVTHQRANDAICSLFLRDASVASGIQQLIWQGEDQDLEWRKAAYTEFQRLIQEGVEESLAFMLIRDVTRNLPCDRDAADRLRIRINKGVARLLQVAPIDHAAGTRACIFIGPTGVGKTTTIAKLAARFALKDHKRVKLLTFDTYRIAAAEQLRTYADIIGIPAKVIFSIDELDDEVSKAGPNDILLIDTTGHSHKRIGEYQELSSYVRDQERIEKHLVMSCTTRQDDLREIVACFSVFRPDKFIFTKLDESSSFGVLLNECVRTNRPLAYLTNGQDVAEDLIVPTPATIADLLVPIE
ncbi:MAG: flagellar biosynthesis protein FlhF [Acidobacteriota bacterium]